MTGFALADLNNDGRVDIAAGTASGLQVLMGAGDGTFAAAATYALALPDPLSVTAADLDLDGDIDLLVDAGSATVTSAAVQKQRNRCVRSRGQPYDGRGKPAFPVVADLNHDGTPDIAAGSEPASRSSSATAQADTWRRVFNTGSSRSSVAPPT